MRSALRVSNVTDLILAGLLSHEINLGRSVVLAKLIEAVVKVVCEMFVYIELCMLSGVFGSSIVAEPNVIACMSNLIGWRFLFVHDPVISA